MTFDYSRLQDTATRLIDNFSEVDVSVERTTGTTTGSDGVVVPGTTTTTSIAAVHVPFSTSQVNNTTIMAGDLNVIIKHDFEPLTDDVFIIDTGRYKVVNIEKYKPSATKLAFRVQVRK